MKTYDIELDAQVRVTKRVSIEETEDTQDAVDKASFELEMEIPIADFYSIRPLGVTEV